MGENPARHYTELHCCNRSSTHEKSSPRPINRQHVLDWFDGSLHTARLQLG